MIRTFLVAVDLGSEATDLQLMAEDIQDSLTQDGFEVSSVKPWDSPSPEITNAFSTQPDSLANSGYGF